MDVDNTPVKVNLRDWPVDATILRMAVFLQCTRQINAWLTDQTESLPSVEADGARWQLVLATDDDAVWRDNVRGEYILVERQIGPGDQIWSAIFQGQARPETPAEHKLEIARAYYLLIRLQRDPSPAV